MTILEGKVVAVTRAASGIGRALCIDLVTRRAHVALFDVNEEGLAATVGSLNGETKVTSYWVDVSDRAPVEAYAAEVSAQHGGADVIINNAGVVARASIGESSYDDLEFVLGVNLRGVIHATKAFFPLMRERGRGHIVDIASFNAFVPFPRGRLDRCDLDLLRLQNRMPWQQPRLQPNDEPGRRHCSAAEPRTAAGQRRPARESPAW